MRRFLLPFALLLSVSLAAQVPSYVPTDGLVAWYGLETDALDASGNGNDLNIVGDPQWLSDNEQGYADLDGNGDYFFNDDPSFPILNEVFLSCWVRIDAFGSGGGSNLRPIISKWNSSGAGENSFIIYESDNKIHWLSDYGSNTTPTFIYEHNWPAGEWHHISAYYGDSLKLFIDGNCVSQDINVSQYDNSNSNFRIGDWYSNISSNYSTLDGGIRSVGIWNRGLNAADAQALFTEVPAVIGCIDATACNFDSEATIDDGNCIPSGCMEEAACNYNAAAECGGEACDYSCCPGPGCCGDGMHWDAATQTCVITPPSVAPGAECTLLNLQELAEGYQILLAANAELDSLLADCNGTSTSDQSGPCSGEGVVTYHGYDYDIVAIGDQCWFAENARFLPAVSPVELGSEDDSGPHAYVFNYQGTDVSEATASTGYLNLGALYNFWAIESWSICPAGWKVPSDGEWKILEQQLGMPSSSINAAGWRGDNQGSQLKSTDSWSVNDGMNSIGMNCLPHGGRISSPDSWVGQGVWGDYWTATTIDANQSWYRGLRDTQTGIYRFPNTRERGLAVRCVKV